MLEMPLAMNQDQFYRQGDHVDLPDLGPGYPGNGLSLVVPSGGVPEEPRIKMLHHTTILALASTIWTVKETGSGGWTSL
uniref:Uncharacterized protein n=1 Tax=Sus scrofa TaxID=9823 RepID=A0A8D0P6D2_PIG